MIRVRGLMDGGQCMAEVNIAVAGWLHMQHTACRQHEDLSHGLFCVKCMFRFHETRFLSVLQVLVSLEKVFLSAAWLWQTLDMAWKHRFTI